MKILLLGNGFDLYHKFPTRYDNFLHTVDYLQQYFDTKIIKTIGDVFGDNQLQDNDSFIPTCYEAYKDVYNCIEIDNIKVKRLISLAQHNLWFKYFLSSYNKELGWIDFEKEITKVIHAFNSFFLKCDKGYVFRPPDDVIDRYIISCFNFFYGSMPISTDSSGFLTTAKRTIIFDDYILEEPFGSEIYIVDKSKIINELYKALLELAEMLKLYLDIFVNLPIEKMLENGYITKKSVFDDMGRVITFNYTHTYEKIYTTQKIHHIHGDLTHRIIIGVNPDASDEPNIDNFVDTVFLQFKKYYQRVLNGSDLDYLKSVKFIKEYKLRFANIRNELYVAGHSLDITDEDILREVFSLADKITIICYNENAIADSINNLIKLYGKKDFDNLRSRTDLEFKLYSDFE